MTVGHAHLDAFHRVQAVQIRNGEVVNAVYHRGVARGHGIEPTAAAGPARGGAKFATHAVQQVGNHLVLGRQRAFAHARRVSLHHAHYAVHTMRRHTRTRAGPTRRGVRGGHERIRAVVNVQERALGAFEQDVGLLADRVMQEHHGVGHQRLQILAGRVVFGENFLKGQLLGTQRLEHTVVFFDARGQLHFEERGINQITHAQAHAGGLVAIRRANAALGGADLVFALEHFALGIQFAMIGEHHMGRLAQREIVGRHLDAQFLQTFDFFHQANRIHHHAVADHAQFLFAENAGGHEVQHILLLAHIDGVTGVIAARITNHDVRLLRQHVDDFAFAFVAPLGAHENRISHKCILPADRTIKIPG